jgi:hypothetical protein
MHLFSRLSIALLPTLNPVASTTAVFVYEWYDDWIIMRWKGCGKERSRQGLV